MNFFVLFLIVIFASTLNAKENCVPKFENIIVNGNSMSPLLKDRQELQLDLNYYNCHSVQRNDIIVFEITGRKNRIIKKVFGTAGDHFEYKNLNIFINKKILKNSLNEPYSIDSKMLKLFSESYPIIPDDRYLVLGDEVNGSFDASKIGFIDKNQILGKINFAVRQGQ